METLLAIEKYIDQFYLLLGSVSFLRKVVGNLVTLIVTFQQYGECTDISISVE